MAQDSVRTTAQPSSAPKSRRNEITLENTGTGVMATFDGPGADTVRQTHGSNVVRVERIAAVSPSFETMEDYALAVRRSWPGWRVGVI